MISIGRGEQRAKIKSNGAGIIYVALVIVALLTGALIGNRWSSTDAAAWVQAGGSLLALAIAIGIAYFQHDSARKKALSDERALAKKVLISIHDELTVRWQQYTEIVGSEVAKAGGIGYVQGFWLLPTHPFPVFEGLRVHLPLIESVDLRREIIRTYALFEGLVLTVNTNSDLARQYHLAKASNSIHGDWTTFASSQLAETALKGYFPAVQQSEKTAREAVERLFVSISCELNERLPAH